MKQMLRSIWARLVWLFALMIPIQFYLAGRSAMEGAAGEDDPPWGRHALFGHSMGAVAGMALIIGLAARLPRALLGLTAALFGTMVLQGVLGGLNRSASTRWIAALHPVNALLLAGIAMRAATRARS